VKRALAFVSAVALGAAVTLPASAFGEPDGFVLAQEYVPMGPAQTITVVQYDAAPLSRDGFTIEILKPPGPAQYTGIPIAGILTVWACSAPVNDGFGPRGSGMHNGIDVMCGHGTLLVASAAGTVIESEVGGSWGQYIKIDHGGGVATLYSHLIVGSQMVAVGQVVAAGEPIGLVGDSGNASVSHLHFEVWVDGIRVDPMPWLP